MKRPLRELSLCLLLDTLVVCGFNLVPTVLAATAAPIRMGNVFYYGITVTNNEGWMTVLAAETSRAGEDIYGQYLATISASKEKAVLEVKIDLWRAFSDEELGVSEGKVLIVDSEGNQYKPNVKFSFSGSMTVSSQSGNSITISPKKNGYGFVFVVPKSTQGFKFRFHDFPAFDLGYPLP